MAQRWNETKSALRSVRRVCQSIKFTHEEKYIKIKSGMPFILKIILYYYSLLKIRSHWKLLYFSIKFNVIFKNYKTVNCMTNMKIKIKLEFDVIPHSIYQTFALLCEVWVNGQFLLGTVVKRNSILICIDFRVRAVFTKCIQNRYNRIT